MRTRWMATRLVAMALTLTGCGDSPEHKLLTANHMLRSNKPADALRLANEVLASDLNPEHAEQMRVQAIEIKVLSLLSLNQLESARKSLEDYRKE